MQEQIRNSKPENFNRLQEFIAYKQEGKLTTPTESAKKILYAINDQKNVQNVVFSVKN